MKLLPLALAATVLGLGFLVVRAHRHAAELTADLSRGETDRRELKTQLASVQGHLSDAKARTATLENDLSTARARQSEAEANVAQLSRELSDQRTASALAAEAAQSHEKAAQALRGELAHLKLTASPFSLADVEALQLKVAALEAEVIHLTPPDVPSDASSHLAPGSLVSVLRVGPGDAFVVLDFGTVHGARPQQVLQITRGTEPVAAVQINEISERLSLALVQPETLRSGLRRGDTASIPSSP